MAQNGVQLQLYLLWRHGIRRAHDTGNLDYLSKLLRSGYDIPQPARKMLAALFDQRLLKKKRGGQRKSSECSATCCGSSCLRSCADAAVRFAGTWNTPV
jgi:hypothetical protein